MQTATPTIRTGNQEWDQNLTGLGSLLFPDPSKVAQGYYYGAEARKAQLESNKLIDQGNWRSRYGMMTQGGPQPGPPTFYQPDLEGAPPVLRPDSNLPMTAGSGLGAAIANTSPAQIAPMIPTAVEPLTKGTPPPFAPPAPGLPASPMTTTTNGGVPDNDPASGRLLPQSVTSSGGGRQQASPATPNGSPAQVPPGMTLPGLLALSGTGSLAGFDAATVAQGGSALAYELYNRGHISKDQYHQMLGATGSPTLATTDTSAAAAIQGHQISAGATIGAANIREAGALKQKGMDLQFVVTKPETGEGVLMPLSQLQGMGGTPTYSPTAVTEQAKAIPVQPGGPGTPAISMPTGTAQAGKVPLYEPETGRAEAASANTIGRYVHPSAPTVVLMRTLQQAQREGLTAAPVSVDETGAVAQGAAQNAPTPAAATAITERRDLVTPTPKPTGSLSDENYQNQTLINQVLGQMMPAKVTKGWFGGAATTQDEPPPAASPELGPVLTDLSNQYFRQGPTKNDRIASTQAALKQMLEEKFINITQSRDKLVNQEVRTKDSVLQVPHFQVDILNPQTGKPYEPGQSPPKLIARIPISAPLSAGAPASGAGPAPIGRAPTGTPAGPRTLNGRPVMVAPDGLIYAQ